MNMGQVLERSHVGPLDSRWYSYELKGGPYYAITYRVLNHHLREMQRIALGEVITIGPFRFIVVEYAPHIGGGAYIVTVADLLGSLRYWWHRNSQWAGEVYRRCILTLHVWGLADYSEVSIPSWRDVGVLRWCVWAAKNCGNVDPVTGS